MLVISGQMLATSGQMFAVTKTQPTTQGTDEGVYFPGGAMVVLTLAPTTGMSCRCCREQRPSNFSPAQREVN